ncbi:MAG TPA: hypothetical protein VGQ02_01635 [Candidatus Limnocylindrales bacterium]|nr:hypothetical protein [Candidatus Limnocylindrales bacterium]
MRLRVRAYNVGFGDCILLSWDEPDRVHHAWVDFGTHFRDDDSSYPGVVASVQAATGGQLDLLMVTHRHLDHLAGFYATRQQLADQFQIERIWYAHVTPTLDAKFELAMTRLGTLLPDELLTGSSSIAAIYQNNLGISNKDRMAGIASLVHPTAVFAIHRELDLTNALPPGWSEMALDVLGPEQDSAKYFAPIDTSLRTRAALDAHVDAWASVGAPEAIDVTAAGEGDTRIDDPTAVPDFLKLADFARLRRLLRGGGTDLLAAVNTSRNNTSIVSRWLWRDVTLLLTGDAELETWQIMRDLGTNFASTVLKVGHHGSINASPAWSYEQVFPTRKSGNAILLSTNPATFNDVNEVPKEEVVEGWTRRMRYPSRFRRTDSVARGAYVEHVFDRA